MVVATFGHVHTITEDLHEHTHTLSLSLRISKATDDNNNQLPTCLVITNRWGTKRKDERINQGHFNGKFLLIPLAAVI